MKSNYLILPLAVVAAFGLSAVPRARANNLIVNGGFEDGVYTSTVGGNTNTFVPVDWLANAAFDLQPNFNDVRNVPHSGDDNLSIGNYDYQDNPVLSQTFSDVLGGLYTASLYVYSSDWDADSFFEASVGGSNFLDPIATGYPISGYTLESFTFVGTGSDTLSLTGNDSPGEWYVDDVSVSGPSGFAGVPDQGMTFLMFGLGLAALGYVQAKVLRRAVV